VQKRRNTHKVWKGTLKERDHLKDLGRDGRITLKWIMGNGMGGYGLDLCGSGWGQMAGCCEDSTEPSYSKKYRVFLG
jgi:hypothetical protein